LRLLDVAVPESTLSYSTMLATYQANKKFIKINDYVANYVKEYRLDDVLFETMFDVGFDFRGKPLDDNHDFIKGDLYKTLNHPEKYTEIVNFLQTFQVLFKESLEYCHTHHVSEYPFLKISVDDFIFSPSSIVVSEKYGITIEGDNYSALIFYVRASVFEHLGDILSVIDLV
jgi:hypothetical protein